MWSMLLQVFSFSNSSMFDSGSLDVSILSIPLRYATNGTSIDSPFGLYQGC